MTLYRDLQPGETLQAGDEQLHNDGAEWVAVETVWIGRPVPEDLQGCFRRPVNLPVLLRKALAEAGALLAEAAKAGGQVNAELAELRQQLATLQSQPRLQPVTLEAMAAIKQRDVSRVLFVTPFADDDGKQHVSIQILHWYRENQTWYEDDDFPAEDTDASHDWFIDLSTIPEVTQ